MIQLMNKWRFRVRWKGYDESNDTWSSWDSLKDVGILNDYLSSQDRADAIPRSHQTLQDRTKMGNPTTIPTK